MADQGIGRPVRIVSIGFQAKTLAEIAALVDGEGARGADLTALPETCRGTEMEPIDGPTVTTMAALASKHSMYVVCPLYRQLGQRRFNSCILLDRQGNVACIYDKLFPYWSEFDYTPGCEPGQDAPVYQADFGRIGLAICFDANFPEVWKRLADQGAELVIWPSAYSAGTTLQAHALTNHFYIVTATGTCDCLVYDITGEEMLYQRHEGLNVSRITLDLDRRIYHENYNAEKCDRLLREHGDDVVVEKRMWREAWFVLKAKRPGVSACALAQQYGMEELRDYIDRSRFQIDQLRGQSFRAKAGREEDSALQHRYGTRTP